MAYYGAIYKKQQFNLDEEQIKEYFPAEHVKEATMNIYQQLLGLDFKKLPDAQTWHKEVTTYEVRDKASKNLLGQFYLDLYPRDDKFSHAAAFTLLKRSNIDGNLQLAAAAMVTNFNPPDGDKPSLLHHREVETFFHEFGHVMHNLCSEANYNRFSGASVEKDFVEMPSQMLENWMWNKDILKKVSKHYKTGESLPDNLIDMKIKTKNQYAATETLSQIFLGSVDFRLYSASDKKLIENEGKNNNSVLSEMRKNIKKKHGYVVDTEDLWHKVAQRIENSDYQEGTNPIGTFGHLITGYVSQYYSYLWS